jgi:nucleoside-diphosphate-sugar epimerase
MGPVNIGSEEMVTINQLVGLVSFIALKDPKVNHIPGPTGVRGRNSDNRLIEEKLGWKPKYTLFKGLIPTYVWIEDQVVKKESMV